MRVCVGERVGEGGCLYGSGVDINRFDQEREREWMVFFSFFLSSFLFFGIGIWDHLVKKKDGEREREYHHASTVITVSSLPCLPAF